MVSRVSSREMLDVASLIAARGSPTVWNLSLGFSFVHLLTIARIDGGACS